MSLNNNEWLKLNQQYLLAEIKVLKEKIQRYLNPSTKQNMPAGNSNPVDIASRELEEIENAMEIIPQLKSLIEIFQLTPFEKDMLLLGLGIELDASISDSLAKIQIGTLDQLPTFSLALSLFSEAHWSALTPEAPLRYWQLIDTNQNPVLTRTTYTVNETILHYVTGISAMDSRISPRVNRLEPVLNLVPSHENIAKQIVQYLSGSFSTSVTPIIQLEGNSTEDLKAIVANAFSKFNLTVYCLPEHLLPANIQEVIEFARLWNREVMLNKYVLFLDVKALNHTEQAKINRVKYLLENLNCIVLLNTAYKFSDLQRMVHSLEVKKPLREEQQKLWKENLGKLTEQMDVEIGTLVSQFNLDSHSIIHLAQGANSSNNGSDKKALNVEEVKDKLWNSCCNYTRPNLSNLAQRIEPKANWEDLVLPELQKSILREICIHVQQCQKVYDEWGFRNKSNRGLAINALFSGESGTGKTMASEVLANALQLDLYRIDLSQVVNKYIGETEKNLKKIFDAAEDSGAILLFDEADALFGKRSEVRDSHDRYSNIEVSFLLQKMEEYRGLAILTTNMKNALDKAFLRRIRFVIQFPFPDAQVRGEIWKRIFPEQTPTKDLDMDKLAKLNVAGGNIRNIALNASFAAANKNRLVTMHDIHNAAKNEYIKLEKNMSPSESLI